MNSQNAPPRLVMSDSEICTSYRQSRDKREQIGILADMNICTKERIIAILTKNGYSDPFVGTTILPPLANISPAPPIPRPRNPEIDSNIRKMIESGASVAEVAKKLDRSVSLIYRRIKQMGINVTTAPISKLPLSSIPANPPKATDAVAAPSEAPKSIAAPPKISELGNVPKAIDLYAKVRILSKVVGDRMNDVMSAFAQGNDNMGLIRLGEMRATLRDLQNELYRITTSRDNRTEDIV